MARHKTPLRTVANQQANAQYNPQIRSTRSGTRQEVRAIRSEEAPLLHGLDAASHIIDGAGLRGVDHRELEQEFAERAADVPAGLVSQVTSAREAGNEDVASLQQSRSEAAASALSSLQLAASEHSQDVADERRGNQEDLLGGLKQAEIEKAFGLGSYDRTPSPLEAAEIGKYNREGHNGGRTPTQVREDTTEHHNAAYQAKQLFQLAKGGGVKGVDPDPTQWDNQTWEHFVTGVITAGKQVGQHIDVPAAQRAVQAVQDHVGGGSSAPALLQSLAGVAATGAAAAGPPDLRHLAAAAGQLIPGFH